MLENAVRPFQSPLLRFWTPAVLPPATTSPAPNSAILCWGQAGEMPTPTSVQYDSDHCNEQHDETTRNSDMIRIDVQDPDGDTPHAIVERAKQIKFDLQKTAQPIPDGTIFNRAGKTVESDLNALAAEIDAINGAFKPQGAFAESDRCKLTVNLNNGPISA